MGQNTEAQDYKILLDRICAAMGTTGKKNATDKFGKGVVNLEHTWEAYHFIGFIEDIFEANHTELMSNFQSLLIKLNIGAYKNGFRRRPSQKGFTPIKAKLLFTGVTNIRRIKDGSFTEHDLLLEFLLFCQKPFITTNGPKQKTMSIFYGEEIDSATTIKQNDPVLIEKAQSRLNKEIEKLKKQSVKGENTSQESDGKYTHDQSDNNFTEDQLAFIFKTIERLPKTIQEELLDKIKKQEIQIAELQADASTLQHKINELLNSDCVTDEIKLLITSGKINEAEKKADQIVATTVSEQRKKHGEYFFQQGNVKELRFKYKEAYEAYKHAVICQPDNTGYLNVAGLLGNKIADYEQAQQFLNKSLELNIAEFGENDIYTSTAYSNLASALDGQGKHIEAEFLYRKSFDIEQRIFGKDCTDSAIGTTYHNLALNLNAQGKYDEAEVLYHKSIDIYQRTLGEDHSFTAIAYVNLASTLEAQEKYNEAEALYHKSINIYQRSFEGNHPNVVDCYSNLALNLGAQEKHSEAELLHRQGIDISRRIFGEEHPYTVSAYNNLAVNIYIQGKYNDSEALFRKCLDINQHTLGENHIDTANCYINLAFTLKALEKSNEAKLMYHNGYKLRLKLLGKHHPVTRDIHRSWLRNTPFFHNIMDYFKYFLNFQ